MSLFKNYLLFFLLLIPFSNFAQSLECCSSDKEIEEAITGYWKIKNDDSKSIYHYWFENGRGNVENVEISETIGEYKPVEKSHSHIYIKKEADTLKLEYIYRYGNWTSVIKKLDKSNLTLETNGESTEYHKVNLKKTL
ncbi:hypothetical protein FG167_08005 [Lacinutrix sp. WUR7]|uniref:hypothetical protein n=1 Tax=Lacinutrix sp. WUR7 TaxID=2653681 RepID=UPI00193D7DAE|nr:hypothetical protein [Lacinutrix sp. WUR7]QRM89178.1 hypothetical protein FG167_08005 [Lacinutrix sp. WUR7]